MKKLITLFLLALISPFLQAEVKAFLDRTKVTTNETFTLTVELDEYTSDEPDLSSMPSSIKIVSSSSYHRSSIINGEATTQLGWKIQLMIDQVGVYTIPAIKVGSRASDPIQVVVEEPKNQFSTDDNLDVIMLRAELSSDSIYVQQQLIYTLRLYRAVQTQYASLTEPKVDNALLEKLGEDRQYESMINNTRYLVLERQYAIFPQESGTLSIPRVIFSADVVQRAAGGVGRILGQTRPITIATEEKSVDVKPFPQDHKGVWLPSTNVKLESRWLHIGEKKVGEPATLTVTLTGVGLHQNQLPDLELPTLDDAKLYPDTAEKTHKVSAEGLTAVRTERIAVVPTKKGDLTIPAITIRWFNTKTGQYEVAELPSETISVMSNPEAESLSQVTMPTDQSINQPIDSPVSYSNGVSNLWFWSTWILFATWLLTLLIFWLKSTPSKTNSSSDTDPLPNTPIKESLIRALAQKDQAQVYRYLGQWFNELAGVSTYHIHLESIADKKLRGSLVKLETAIYSTNKQEWLDHKLIRSNLSKIERFLVRSKQSSKTVSELPSLYPQN